MKGGAQQMGSILQADWRLFGMRWLAAAGLFVAATVPAAAQGPARNASLAVTVVVTRSCVLETPSLSSTPAAPATGAAASTVQITCGKDRLVYPLQPGAPATPLRGGAATPGVAQSRDGRTVTIQF